MSGKRQLNLPAFWERHPVFRLEELAAARGEPDRNDLARAQLQHHIQSGRVLSLSRGLYAAVPPGLDPSGFQPDRFQTANAARPDVVFCHHAALEILGLAYSVWHECTAYSDATPARLGLGSVEIRFLAYPAPFRAPGVQQVGLIERSHGPTVLRLTGPERTLVDGLKSPRYAGGLNELLDAFASYGGIDFEVLSRVLDIYDQKSLWAGAGWLAERHRDAWATPDAFLASCRKNQPRGKQYLVRSWTGRGGDLLPEWNLIVPPGILSDLRDA